MQDTILSSAVNPINRRWGLWILLIMFYVGLAGTSRAESGIIAWKEQPFHADASARVFYFESMERTGPITWFYRGGDRMGLEPHQSFEMVIIPGSLAELTAKAGSDELKRDYARLSAFAAKYPAAKTLLKSRMEQMAMYLKNYEAGTIASSGKWMPVSDYDKINAKQNSPEKAAPVKPAYKMEAYVVCAVYLFTLLAFTLWRKRTPVLLLLILPFILAFSWFSYEEKGFGWFKRTPEKMKESFERLGWP